MAKARKTDAERSAAYLLEHDVPVDSNSWKNFFEVEPPEGEDVLFYTRTRYNAPYVRVGCYSRGIINTYARMLDVAVAKSDQALLIYWAPLPMGPKPIRKALDLWY